MDEASGPPGPKYTKRLAIFLQGLQICNKGAILRALKLLPDTVEFSVQSVQFQCFQFSFQFSFHGSVSLDTAYSLDISHFFKFIFNQFNYAICMFFTTKWFNFQYYAYIII
jgi:hypothetical protein